MKLAVLQFRSNIRKDRLYGDTKKEAVIYKYITSLAKLEDVANKEKSSKEFINSEGNFVSEAF